MSLVVTGATGQLGRLTVEALLHRGISAEEIVATGRNLTPLKDLADRGVVVRRADFAEVDSLATAFTGADKLLLVSASYPVADRLAHHRRTIDAALAAGVSLIAYTSMAHADAATTILGTSHDATEKYLIERDAPRVLLRNSWYLDNYIAQLPMYLQNGTVLGAAGEGRVSAAARVDYAEAAAVVLSTEGHTGAVYELGGDEAFTLTELAATISAATGKPITYTNLPEDAFTEALKGAGLTDELARVIADSDRGLRRGELYSPSGDLSRLIGHPTKPLADAVAHALH